MRNRLFALFVVAALPALAAGQYDPRRPPPRGHAGPRDQGLTLSARLAYGAPAGDISDEVDAGGAPLYPKLDDLVRHKVPIWLELGYRFNPAVWGGFSSSASSRAWRRSCATWPMRLPTTPTTSMMVCARA